jgi:hypothetical protein
MTVMEMRRCMEDWRNFSAMCLETTFQCTNIGKIPCMFTDCIEMCQMCVICMMRMSLINEKECAMCAEMCMTCAILCQGAGDNPMMERPVPRCAVGAPGLALRWQSRRKSQA